MSEWKAQILYDKQKGRFGWPYTVFLTQSRYPFGYCESIHSTKRGARRGARAALKQYQEQGERRGYPPVVEEIT